MSTIDIIVHTDQVDADHIEIRLEPGHLRQIRDGIAALGTSTADKLGQLCDKLDYEILQKMDKRIAALESKMNDVPPTPSPVNIFAMAERGIQEQCEKLGILEPVAAGNPSMIQVDTPTLMVGDGGTTVTERPTGDGTRTVRGSTLSNVCQEPPSEHAQPQGDEAAVRVMCEVCRQYIGHTWEETMVGVLAAIRRGEVPGIWCGELAENIASAQLVAALRARVAELEGKLAEAEKERDANEFDYKRIRAEFGGRMVQERERADKAQEEIAMLRSGIEKTAASFHDGIRAMAEREKLKAELAAERKRADERADAMRKLVDEAHKLVGAIPNVCHGPSVFRDAVAQYRKMETEAAQWKERAEKHMEAETDYIQQRNAWQVKHADARAEADALRAEVAALKARKVKLPVQLIITGVEVYYAHQVRDAIRAAGLDVES